MNKKKLIQKVNLENLLIISKILKENKHFIFYGTLLGITREENILKGDDDIDILIDVKLKKKVLKLIVNTKKFRINKKVSNYNFTQLTRMVKGQKTFVDLYFYINKPKNNYLEEKHNFLASINLESHSLHIPKKLVFPIKKSRKFPNVCLPNNSKKLCKYLYGPTWLTPLKKNSGYRMEIINHKPKLIQRSRLGSVTRNIKQLFNNEFKKI